MKNAIHVSATINKELYRRMNEFCEKEERSKSWVISKALKTYLEELEDIEITYQRMTNPKEKIISSKELRKRLNV